jgi:hypothetical protein
MCSIKQRTQFFFIYYSYCSSFHIYHKAIIASVTFCNACFYAVDAIRRSLRAQASKYHK